MKFIFSTGSLYTYSIDRCFGFAKKAGFDGIEVLMDYRWDTRQAEFILSLIKKHKFPVYSVHSPFKPVFGWKAPQPYRIKKAIEIAREIGATVLVHHLPLKALAGLFWFRKDVEKIYRQWLVREYNSVQKATPIILCIENMPAKKILGIKVNYAEWNTVKKIMQFGSIALDTTHLGTWGLGPAEVYEKWHEKVNHIHISNYDGREHRRPDIGRIDLKKFLQTLAKYKYDKAVTVELHPNALKAGKSDDTIVQLMTETLKFCRKWGQASTND